MNKEQIVYINTASELAKHIPAIEKAPRVAVDLEFDRNRYKYGFTMCLMQIMAGDICYLIDPLNEELDLSPIYKILEDLQLCMIQV
jgi:ribonuclease D